MRLVAALVSVILFGSAQAQADIMIGVAGPLSGQNAVFGEQMTLGVQQAIEMVNASGGINGERLVMTAGDDACDTRRAVTVAEDFVRQDVRVVIGHFCSGAALAAAPTYEQAGILMISPTATDPAVTTSGFWNVLRLANRADQQANVAAARIASDNANAKLAIVNDGQSAGRALAERMKERVASALEITIKAGVADQAAAVTAMQQAGITAVYFTTAATDAGNIAAALRKAGVEARLYGPDTLLSDVYWDRAGEAGEGTQVTFTTDPASLVLQPRLQDLFLSKNLSIDGAVIPSFAAVEIFVAAARARNVNDARSLATWLSGGATVETIMGDITFDGRGDVTEPRFTWYTWNEGQFSESPTQN